MKSVLISLVISLMVSVPMFFINRNLEHSQVNALMCTLLLLFVAISTLLILGFLKSNNEAFKIATLLSVFKTGDVYERQEESGTECFAIVSISRSIEEYGRPLKVEYLNCTGAYQGLNESIGTACPSDLLTEYEYLGNLNGKTPIFQNLKTE